MSDKEIQPWTKVSKAVWKNRSHSDSSEECQDIPEELKFNQSDFSRPAFVREIETSVSRIHSFNQSPNKGPSQNELPAAGDVSGSNEDNLNVLEHQFHAESEPVKESSQQSYSNLIGNLLDIAESPDVLPPQDHPQPSQFPPYAPSLIRHQQYQSHSSSSDSHLHSDKLHSEGPVEVFPDLHLPPSDTFTVNIQACVGIEISTGPVVIVEEANETVAHRVRNEAPEMYDEISTGPIVEPEPMIAQSVRQASSLLENCGL